MNLLKNIPLLLLAFLLVTVSCRQEDEEIIDPPTEQSIDADSPLADLLINLSRNDGSFDNIIDGASCFSIQLPVNVIVNGIELEIVTVEDYQLIEDIFESSDTDTDTLDIVFPITIIFDDYSTQDVNSYGELIAYAAQCQGENSDDDDIECIDILYPLTASIFDENNQQIDTIIIENDEDLFDFIQNLGNYAAVTLEFPITVILADGTQQQITSIQELLQAIEDADGTCDEDDDNDYDDDDCPDCTTTELTDVLTNCNGWYIDSLERNDADLEDQYNAYMFMFLENGTLSVDNGGQISEGSWSSSGEGNAIEVVINVPGLSDINDTWLLNEIEQDDDGLEVELRKGDDELEFQCGNQDDDDDNDDDCNNCTQESVTNLLVDCTNWTIDQLERNDEDLEDQYASYQFAFEANGTVNVDTGSTTTSGTWSLSGSGNSMNFSIDVTDLSDVNGTWNIHSIDNGSEDYQVDLRIGDDRLKFESSCSGTNGGDDDLTQTLTEGNSSWIVSNYNEEGEDQTSFYTGYQFEFTANGTVNVTGTETVTGSWASLNNGTEMFLNLSETGVLEELNDDDWEVLSITTNEVQLRDISGGNGGTDLLTFERI